MRGVDVHAWAKWLQGEPRAQWGCRTQPVAKPSCDRAPAGWQWQAALSQLVLLGLARRADDQQVDANDKHDDE